MGTIKIDIDRSVPWLLLGGVLIGVAGFACMLIGSGVKRTAAMWFDFSESLNPLQYITGLALGFMSFVAVGIFPITPIVAVLYGIIAQFFP